MYETDELICCRRNGIRCVKWTRLETGVYDEKELGIIQGRNRCMSEQRYVNQGRPLGEAERGSRCV